MQVSHSRIETFNKCRFQYKLRYIDKLKTYFNNDPSNALIIGTALHTGIEESVGKAIEWYYSQYPIVDDRHVEEAIKLEYVIKKCKEVLPPGGTYELKIETDEFVGYIDYLVEVEPNVYDLYDFKYSNNVDNYKKSGQLHEYKFFFEQIHPEKTIRNMYFLFAPKVAIKMKYKNKTNKRDETLDEFRRRLKSELEGKEPQIVQIEYDSKKVEEFLENAQLCRTSTTFKKNPTNLCDWCEYKEYCMNDNTLDIDWEASGIAKGERDNMQLPENKRRNLDSSTKKKIWIYGQPFSGKTYLANRFPDPLMLNTDGNVKYVDAPYVAIKDEVKVEGRMTKRTFAWEVLKDAIAELEKKQNDFKTIVLDLLEDTYEQCRLYMYEQLGITHESDDSFRAWDKVRIEFLSTIKRLMALDYENIILISHEDTSKDITKKTGDKITAIKPNLNEKAALKIAGMVDLVCRVINDNNERVISLKNNEVVFGGGRLGIKAEELPCTYEALMDVYQAAIRGEKKIRIETPKREARNPQEIETPKVEEVETTTAIPTEVETPEAPTRARRTRNSAPVEEPKEEVKETPVEPTEPELPKRRVRTTPTAHEEKVAEFKAEHPVEETHEAPRRVRRTRG